MLQKNTFYYGDNVEYLKQIDDQSIDLIYIDPQFFTQTNYDNFSDVWKNIEEYIIYLQTRIQECYRILKLTGSFYLHLDYHAVHYMKNICDRIFGQSNFRGEIIWQYGSISGFKSQKNGWIRNHDNILYYTKSDNFCFNKLYIRHTKAYYEKIHNGRAAKEIMEKDGTYYYKRYDNRLVEIKNGSPISDVWIDIPSFQTIPRSTEYLRYDTQKPEALLERIIQASSNEGDLILDCFCGSGTTCAVAKKLRRNFIGIDINERAILIAKERINNICLIKRLDDFYKFKK